MDDVIELYMKDVDMSLIEANLRLTPEQRILKLQTQVNFILELRRAKAQADLESGKADD